MTPPDRRVTVERFGALPDGSPVDLYTLRQDALELQVITYGAIVTSLRVPDRQGRTANVVLGHDTLEGYLDNRPYLGAVVGRYANRIARGRFSLDGVQYALATNDGPNHLHGGVRGFDRHCWTATTHVASQTAAVTFARVSPAGEEGYPGTLRVSVTYQLAGNGDIAIRYEATTDQPTIINLTQHTYFNLAGDRSPTILDHRLMVHADRFLPIDNTLIPLGTTASVAGTAFDLRKPVVLRSPLSAMDATTLSGPAGGADQLRRAGGFDHTFVLEGLPGLQPAAMLQEPRSGRTLEIATTEPGLQVYTGQQLDGRSRGAGGRRLEPFAGLCLETQHFPDTPNHPDFPTVTLRPGEYFDSTTMWRFGTT